jgi:hypothetical protein
MNSEYEFIVATFAIFIRRGEVENVMGLFPVFGPGRSPSGIPHECAATGVPQ